MPAKRSSRDRPTPEILAYHDRGVSEPLLRCVLHALRREARGGVRVETLSAKHLRRPGTLSGARLLVMPGGRDLPYCQELDGEGCDRISAFVEGGGAYLGLCAGSYFACERVEYRGPSPAKPWPGSVAGETDAPAPPICGERELGLIRGTALVHADASDIASTRLDPMATDTLGAVGVVRVRPAGDLAVALAEDTAHEIASLSWLGPRFALSDDTAADTHALAADAEGHITIARALRGKGIAIACGLHPEVSADGFREALIFMTEHGVAYDESRAATILSHLHEHERGRRALFRSLLLCADLADLLRPHPSAA